MPGASLLSYLGGGRVTHTHTTGKRGAGFIHRAFFSHPIIGRERAKPWCSWCCRVCWGSAGTCKTLMKIKVTLHPRYNITYLLLLIVHPSSAVGPFLRFGAGSRHAATLAHGAHALLTICCFLRAADTSEEYLNVEDATDTVVIRTLLIEHFPGLATILPGCALARNGGTAAGNPRRTSAPPSGRDWLLL